MNKKQSLRVHAKRRLKERYGLAVGRKALLEIVGKIQKGEATFVRRSSCRVTLWDVELHERLVRVVYDTHRKTIVTALPQRLTNVAEVR